jgi:hypothetical protein
MEGAGLKRCFAYAEGPCKLCTVYGMGLSKHGRFVRNTNLGLMTARVSYITTATSLSTESKYFVAKSGKIQGWGRVAI